MSKHVKILLPKPFDKTFDYSIPEKFGNISVGSYLKVPFGKQKIWGVVWQFSEPEIDMKKIKNINAVSDIPKMPQTMMEFISWVASYTLSPIGSVLNMAISVDEALEDEPPEILYKLGNLDNLKMTNQRRKVIQIFEKYKELPMSDITEKSGMSEAIIKGMAKVEALEKITRKKAYKLSNSLPVKHKKVTLSNKQQEVANILKSYIYNKYSCSLLEGITGSGKTEVYSEAVAQALDNGKQVLVLLPEIALTTQLAKRFKDRFGFSPVKWHSGMTKAQRRDSWRLIARGETKLVIGARSSLFLPFPKLGLIVVDEEHEPSFKQEDGVIYHARDMAIARASHHKIPIILSSASPSIESLVNTKNDKYRHVLLKERHGNAVLPNIEIVDMRSEQLNAQHWLSEPVKYELAQTFERGEQSMLFLNRRGYAPLTLCRHCGYRFQSPDSSSWMVLHKNFGRNMLVCHHSGYTMPLPEKCPECDKEDSFAACGPGVERLEEEVKEFFPKARILQFTSDNISTSSKAEDALEKIEKAQIDIIIGTQMVAKGHHFPALTFVGVIDADIGLEGGDMRAAERNFQLLEQVSGRAGRSDLPGKAIIQTYYPDSLLMNSLVKSDRKQFVETEINTREKAKLPPYSRMAGIIVHSKKDSLSHNFAMNLMRTAPQAKGVRILGPAPAPMLLLRGNYRYRLLVITEKNINIQGYIRNWMEQHKTPSNIVVKVDIDPQSFM